jgi:hypothetical protein
MAQVWAVSTTLEVDAPHARAGADWMCLVLAKSAPMTHAGAVSIASIVDAPMIPAGADFKVRAVDAPIAYSGTISMVLVVKAPMSCAKTDLRREVVNAPLICSSRFCTGADSRFWKMIARTTHAGTDSMALVAEAPMARTGADMLGMALNCSDVPCFG